MTNTATDWHRQPAAAKLIASLAPHDLTLHRHTPIIGPDQMIYVGMSDVGIDVLRRLSDMRSAATAQLAGHDFEYALHNSRRLAEAWIVMQDSLPTVQDALEERFGRDLLSPAGAHKTLRREWDRRANALCCSAVQVTA